MPSDAHCHPFNLLDHYPEAEDSRRELGILCASSSCTKEQFEYHEGLAKRAAADGAAPVLLCFGVHPQSPAGTSEGESRNGLKLLQELANNDRLDGVGESGFDLFNAEFRATEALQEELFTDHLEIAFKKELPLILHIRRAMSKVFNYAEKLKKVPALVFHSYSGTLGEAEAVLNRGINAFFSFGTPIMLNHLRAMECAARLPAERLLFETDAPYQPLREKSFSSWADLAMIRKTAAQLRKAAGSFCTSENELEIQTDSNFKKVFGL